MTKNIGPHNSAVPQFGEVDINGRVMVHHMDVMDFPSDDQNRETCMEHIADGRMGEMLNEFWLTGCHSPDQDEESLIRTAFICAGPSMFKDCRLRILQAKLDGEVITEGKYSS